MRPCQNCNDSTGSNHTSGGYRLITGHGNPQIQPKTAASFSAWTYVASSNAQPSFRTNGLFRTKTAEISTSELAVPAPKRRLVDDLSVSNRQEILAGSRYRSGIARAGCPRSVNPLSKSTDKGSPV